MSGKTTNVAKYDIRRTRNEHSRSECFAEVAQSVEHMHGKHEVVGSIPILGSRWVL